jgi:hypothetical protein
LVWSPTQGCGSDDKGRDLLHLPRHQPRRQPVCPQGTGDHIVSSPSHYGGTYNLFHHILPKIGITVSFVDYDEARAGEGPHQELGVARRIAQLSYRSRPKLE